MTMHRIEFDYDLPEGGFMEVDIDPRLDGISKRAIAYTEIKESFPDALNVNIVNIEEV